MYAVCKVFISGLAAATTVAGCAALEDGAGVAPDGDRRDGLSCPAPALTLTSVCSPDPSAQHVWRVRNPVASTVSARWEIYGSQQAGTIEAASGDSYFVTSTSDGNTAKVTWTDVCTGARRQTVKAAGNASCPLGDGPSFSACVAGDECASGVCSAFGATGSLCSNYCTTSDQCSLTSAGCGARGVCEPTLDHPVDLLGRDRTSATPPGRPRPTSGAADQFFRAFAAADYDALPGVITALEAQLREPATDDLAGNDAWLPLTAALSYLWQSAESARDPAFPPSQAQANTTRALELLALAGARNPRDLRPASFEGAIKMTLGRALLAVPSPDVQAQGRALFDAGEAQLDAAFQTWPEFHGFTYSLVRANAPAPSASELDESIDGIVQSMRYCFGQAAVASSLDVRPLIRAGVPSSGFRRSCTNNWIIPHSIEGFFLMAGDMFVRRGQPQDLVAARTLYENAKASPDYGTWGFRPMLEARLREIQARAAAYRDANSSNDPFIGPRVSQCVLCHATAAQLQPGD